VIPPTKTKLLVVDDDPGVVDFLCENLVERGFDATGLTSPRDALARIRSESFDLLISDVVMPELRGVELLSAVLRERPNQLVLLMTAFGSIELAVATIRAGACDFISKPFRIEAFVAAIERAMRDREVRREIVRLSAAAPPEPGGPLIVRSPAMRRALKTSRRSAASDATILFTGETGSGKSALARFVHQSSPRRDGPFLEVNCASLPTSLVESELFGVRRGAFTGAQQDRTGLFVAAGDGTLFLDEIGDLPLETQVKLLHALEGGRVRPVGGTSEVPIKARLVAATNRPLEELVRDGQFRADLYYRLNVIRIQVPPLRERREDIPPLADRFLRQAAERHSRSLLGVSAAAVKRLLSYHWPGNVRELANVIERAVALSEHDTIVPEDLQFLERDDAVDSLVTRGTDGNLPLEELERAYVRSVVQAQGGNKAAAARILKITRNTLYRKLDA